MRDFSGKRVQANYVVGFESVGGHLTFQNDGIFFESHSLNVQTGTIKIPYSCIRSAAKRGLLTGISVFTTDGAEHKFVVYHRSDVVDFLNMKKSTFN